MSRPRIEHLYSGHDGIWRNTIFTEGSSWTIKKTDRDGLGTPDTPWGPTLPPWNNFWLVAELVNADTFIQCSYNTDSLWYNEDHETVDRTYYERYWSPTWSRSMTQESVGEDPWTHYDIEFKRTATWRATVPEGDSIRLYFGTDLFTVCGRGDPIYAEGTQDSGAIWHGWDDYFDDVGTARGAWAVSEVFYIDDPQPPDSLDPPVGEFHFVKYLKIEADGDTVDGTDWIPDPTTHDSMIGLVFSTTDSDSDAAERPVYEVFEVTQWWGKDMNTKPSAFEPVRQDSVWFDFWVDQPLYDGVPKYTVTTRSYDEVIEFLGGGTKKLSTRRYTVERNAAVKGDTLWLIAKDYAAHAVIIPRGLSTYTLRLKQHTNPFNGAPLWGVTVPRDYDGWQDVGLNKGDMMADKWEADMLGVGMSNQALLTFYPFYSKNIDGAFDARIMADFDTIPKGRDVDGDRFVNWVEYRGFHVIGDIDSVKYIKPKHTRLKPRSKSVMIDWRWSQLSREPEITDNIPGWLDKLESSQYDTLEMFFVDANLIEGDRFRTSRNIIFNRNGAYFFYYSVPGLTFMPAPFSQNAISWWNVNDDEKRDFSRRIRRDIDGSGYIGFTVSYEPGSYCVPFYHLRSWVYLSEIEKWQDSTYYNNNPNQWQQDYPKMIQFAISHEFGHSVGMNHTNSQIMVDPAPIYTIIGPNLGRFFYPSFTEDYSGVSRSELSTRYSP